MRNRDPKITMSKDWCTAAAHREAEAEITNLQWAITRLRSGLENWGRHHPHCEYSGDKPCNCGLTALLADTQPADTASSAPTACAECARLRADAERMDWLEGKNAQVREAPILPSSCGHSVRRYIDQHIEDEATPRAASQEGRHE